MEEESTTKCLKEVNRTMVNILSKKYGLKEDAEFITPLKPTKNKVRMLELKKQSETDEVHKHIRLVQKLLLKINDGVDKVQKSTYQYLMTKKRQRDNEHNEKEHKKIRKEDSLASRQRQSALNTVSDVSFVDLYRQMGNSGDDLDEEFDDLR